MEGMFFSLQVQNELLKHSCSTLGRLLTYWRTVAVMVGLPLGEPTFAASGERAFEKLLLESRAASFSKDGAHNKM